MNKIRYDPAARTVIYKTRMVAGPNRNFEVFDALDFPGVHRTLPIIKLRK